MIAETFLDGKIVLHCGDSRDVLKTIPDCSIDSIVTDPPYALVSIVKRFGAGNAAAVKVPEGGSGAYARASAGFMGKAWDTGETAFAVDFWAECLRVLKPGGHVVAFSGTRTYHRMTCAIEDAGFEIRDQIGWAFGSGFPKSHDVAWSIAKGAAARFDPQEDSEGNTIWCEQCGEAAATFNTEGTALYCDECHTQYVAGEWSGFGTAIKPAWEPVCMARRPLKGTVAANVLAYGTGGINIDGCRIDASGRPERTNDPKETNSIVYAGRVNGGEGFKGGSRATGTTDQGRWPANIVHDGSDDVLAAFPESDGQQGVTTGREPSAERSSNTTLNGLSGNHAPRVPRGDAGSAARFFYTAKADSDDRLGSKHPTVKPVDLMQWLCRLVTPPGGTVLDPFAGTGTTGEAAFREGFKAVLIEREPEYQADIRRRMALVMSGPEERKRESIKAKLGDVPFEAGSLFAGIEEKAG